MQASNGRNTVVDFWRGNILVMIFINHIPGNLLEHMTPRNFGFSDSTEAFIFISGLSVALAYYPKLPQGDAVGVIKRCVRRSVELYRMHLILTGIAIALFSVGYVLSDEVVLIEAHGRGTVFANTAQGITGVLFLGHQLGYFNILPLYIALMLWAPMAMILMRIHLALAMLTSTGIYLLARADFLAFPSWPEPGRWFFNPFAWQLLFTIGIATGAFLVHPGVPYLRLFFPSAVVILLASVVIMTDAFGLAPDLLWQAFNDLDIVKSNLGLGRLVHFLALASVVTQLRLGQLFQNNWVGTEMMRLGRNALLVFAVGSVLSALGEVITALAVARTTVNPHALAMIFTMFGILGLLGLARYLEWNKKSSSTSWTERSGPAGPLQVPAGPVPQ